MLLYKYTAKNPKTGEKISSELQADSIGSATKLIQEQGLTPITVKAVNEDSSMGMGKLLNRVKTKDKVVFSRQLSTLIGAGLPLVQSLRNVLEQTSNKTLKLAISQIISDVEAGKPFSEALSKHPKIFDKVFVSLIGAGEISGTLDESLERVANQQEKDAEIVSKVRGALVYPIIVLLVMVGVVVFMLVTVLPQVEILYDGLEGAGELPIFTRALLAVSHFIEDFWFIVLGVLAFGGFMGSRWANTVGGRSTVDRLKMHIWPIGPLFMKMYMARFARTGTTMVASGVPLIQTLEIIGEAVNNVHIKKSIQVATEKVKGGKALSESIRVDPNFLRLVPDMLKIGEDSGQMEAMLEKTATYYEKEVDEQIKTVSTIIEPVMMVILGVVALVIVAAILLPIYGLAGKGLIK
jgi:type IV pilus assembly protein PilC